MREDLKDKKEIPLTNRKHLKNLNRSKAVLKISMILKKLIMCMILLMRRNTLKRYWIDNRMIGWLMMVSFSMITDSLVYQHF